MSPVFADALVSLSVLADTFGDEGSAVRPAGGETAASRPKAIAVFAACGNWATSASVAIAFSVAASGAAPADGCDGPLEVVFGAADFFSAVLGVSEADFFMAL